MWKGFEICKAACKHILKFLSTNLLNLKILWGKSPSLRLTSSLAPCLNTLSASAAGPYLHFKTKGKVIKWIRAYIQTLVNWKTNSGHSNCDACQHHLLARPFACDCHMEEAKQITTRAGYVLIYTCWQQEPAPTPGTIYWMNNGR